LATCLSRKAYAEQDTELMACIRFPALDSLHSDPRWANLLNRLKPVRLRMNPAARPNQNRTLASPTPSFRMQQTDFFFPILPGSS
jgi:hypothetical protein